MQSVNLDMDDFYDRDGFDDDPFVEEAEEVPDPEERRRGRNNNAGQGDDNVPTDEQVLAGMDKTLPKRRTLKPQPKLDEKRLCGETGISALPEIFKDWKPNSKKDEYTNLCSMMNKLENWAHRLYPKLKFDDFLARVEQLGDKRAVKTHMQKLRMDMPLGEEDAAPTATTDSQKDADDNNGLTAAGSSPQPTSAAPVDDDYDPFDDVYGDSPVGSVDSNTGNAPPLPSVAAPPPTTSTITDEQRQRMEANRLRAIELRQKRLEYYARQDMANSQETASSDVNENESMDTEENRDSVDPPSTAPTNEDTPEEDGKKSPEDDQSPSTTQPQVEADLLDEDDVMKSLCDDES